MNRCKKMHKFCTECKAWVCKVLAWEMGYMGYSRCGTPDPERPNKKRTALRVPYASYCFIVELKYPE